ncbi:hypothetical protein ZHAS_00004680 [Anopheles sinensis]|uniref:Uncharacterized protein n=1 Tax=Anopheles sinensis TaxID=74873 RepID=A0A084VHD8_ANOSI|nr:hypothetical protein ZHAS_00004680 [Anopheles sinensis]
MCGRRTSSPVRLTRFSHRDPNVRKWLMTSSGGSELLHFPSPKVDAPEMEKVIPTSKLRCFLPSASSGKWWESLRKLGRCRSRRSV